jgi:hypothetical protein
MDNQQVLQLHQSVMEEQDESLDRLSASIRNQRELSIQIGDELDSHVRLLDDVDELVDRHQTRLDSAKRRLNSVARTAKDHGTFLTRQTTLSIANSTARELDGHHNPHHNSGAPHCDLEVRDDRSDCG